jgi:hypothetical protein
LNFICRILLFEVPLLDDVCRQDVGLVRVASCAGELAEVETEPEGVHEGAVDLHAAVVAKVTLFQHRRFDVAEILKLEKLKLF